MDSSGRRFVGVLDRKLLTGSATLFIGPIFQREAAIAPRRIRLYAARAAYTAALLMLVFTAWLVIYSSRQTPQTVGSLARFGDMAFQILAPLQLACASFFAALLAAAAMAQEKDRRTMVLLIMTRLGNSELVLGKLLASMLDVLSMLTAAIPFFMLLSLLGGISYSQITKVFIVTFFSAIACGSLGSLMALWREKTFQALAISVLAIVLWTAAGEIVGAGFFGERIFGLPAANAAACFSPWRAVVDACAPFPQSHPALGAFGYSFNVFVFVAVSIVLAANGLAVWKVRDWSCAQESPPPNVEEKADVSADAKVVRQAKTRRVWDNPVLWREIRTWAYGRKILAIRAVYIAIFALAAGFIVQLSKVGGLAGIADGGAVLIPLLLLSVILVNAQAVTSLTAERDVKALDLLLVTDLTPKEIVFGKLGGICYNAKEMILLPWLLCVYLGYVGAMEWENVVFILAGTTVMYGFAAFLGIHSGISYENSGSAIAVSLGTLFFLTIGVAACMRIMLAFSDSFQAQFVPFFAFMALGGVGLYIALGSRNPSSAIGVASFVCPFATYYAITSYLLGANLALFLSVSAAYGFTTLAMLIPAIYEFDVASGKANFDE